MSFDLAGFLMAKEAGKNDQAKQLKKEIAAKDARIAELEAHCLRLGQGGAERYWEGRWRDEAARAIELEALLREARPFVKMWIGDKIACEDEKAILARIDAALSPKEINDG